MDRNQLEMRLSELPLYQYAFVRTEDLMFSERIRWICEHECPMYNRTWACPPAVGSVEDCQARCLAFEDALVIATITEVSDIANIEETLATRPEHEEITREVLELVQQQAQQTMVLSTEACAVCESCAWPDAPCRFREKMFPCVESHGIVVTDLAEKAGIDFFADGGNLVTWFSLIFYR